MCGIVAMMSTEKRVNATVRAKVFTQGVIVDTMRGHHSTGLVYVDDDGDVETYKKAMPGYDFVDTPKFNSITDDIYKYPFLIAHNRWATKGKVNANNAHPFQHDHITGVHNGSLYTWRGLAPNHDFETDSEYIFRGLADAEDNADILEHIDGAFALVWHDARDNTVHVCRNDDRPFHIAHVKGEDTIVCCSEEEMLRFILDRNGMDTDTIYQAGSGYEFTFSLDNLSKPRVREHTLLEDSWGNYRYSNYNGWEDSYAATRNRINTSSANITTIDKNEDPNSPVGTRIRCNIMDFVKYSGSGDYGYLHAMSIEDPYDIVRVNGLTSKEQSAIPHDCFEAKVVAESIDADNDGYLSCDRNGIVFMNQEAAYRGFNYDDGTLNRSADGKILHHSVFEESEYSRLEEEEKKSIASALDDDLAGEDKNAKEVAVEDSEKKTKDKGNIIVLPESNSFPEEDTFYTKEGVVYTKREARGLLIHGCSLCGDPITLHDFNDLEWHYGDSPICVNCVMDVDFTESH